MFLKISFNVIKGLHGITLALYDEVQEGDLSCIWLNESLVFVSRRMDNYAGS